MRGACGSLLAVLALLAASPSAGATVITVTPGGPPGSFTFSKTTEYKVTMSGVIAFHSTDQLAHPGEGHIDPLFSYTGDCGGEGLYPSTFLRVEDAAGNVISPHSQTPRPVCRSDHTYSLIVNDDSHAPAYDISGPAKVTIGRRFGPDEIASGGFTLDIEENAPRSLSLKTKVPERFSRQAGVPIDEPSADEIRSPEGFEVYVDVEKGNGPCPGDAKYRFTVDGKQEKAKKRHHCAWTVLAPEGEHTIKVTARAKEGSHRDIGETDVTVQDFLIVGIGDSVASGEGNPDVPSRTSSDERWTSRRCHRSGYSFQALAADAVEDHDRRSSSVTFVHLACSGASIVNGLLGPYAGIEERRVEDLPAQVAEARRLVGHRKVDAVLLNIGANDLEFGKVLTFCYDETPCWDLPYGGYPDLRSFFHNRFLEMSGRYQDLAAALAGLAPAARVYITQYGDPTFEQDGVTYCDGLIAGRIDRDETRVLSTDFAKPLNAAIAAAADKWRWKLVGGQDEAFRRHGYCADASNRWMVSLFESRKTQSNNDGTMHPNRAGHHALAGLLVPHLLADLFPGGKPRPPDAR